MIPGDLHELYAARKALTLAECAEMYGVDKRTVTRWCSHPRYRAFLEEVNREAVARARAQFADDLDLALRTFRALAGDTRMDVRGRAVTDAHARTSAARELLNAHDKISGAPDHVVASEGADQAALVDKIRDAVRGHRPADAPVPVESNV